jgi:hypothetical protein
MKIESQVCSLDLAKRLKELGVKQESLFSWFHVQSYNGPDDPPSDWEIVLLSSEKEEKLYSAFTVAELGEMLPKEIIGDEGMRFDMNSWRQKDGKWAIGYWWDEDSRRQSGMVIENIFDNTEANARAKCLIYLLENNLIEL